MLQLKTISYIDTATLITTSTFRLLITENRTFLQHAVHIHIKLFIVESDATFHLGTFELRGPVPPNDILSHSSVGQTDVVVVRNALHEFVGQRCIGKIKLSEDSPCKGTGLSFHCCEEE